jgi:hypothetical protein
VAEIAPTLNRLPVGYTTITVMVKKAGRLRIETGIGILRKVNLLLLSSIAHENICGNKPERH